MALFVIADLHLSLGASKPMDIFPGWDGYVERLEKNWLKLIKPEDSIVIAGDISWSMRLEDTKEDFRFLNNLPGQKYLLKGNHDYWWTTTNKMEKFFQSEGFDTFKILHNNSYYAEGYEICGSRGWIYDESEPQDEKIMNREVGRLKASLQTAGKGEKLVFLHYPPVYPNCSAEKIIQTLNDFQIKKCFYGHLHGKSIHYAIQGDVEDIRYKLISADALHFCPYQIN